MITGLVEDGLYRALEFNPCVAIHELRLRMRGIRPFLVLLGYSLVAATAVLIALSLQVLEWRSYSNPGYAHNDLGRTTFAVLAYTQLTLVVFVLPAYAAGAITLEREKQTLEMLQVTRLSASDVVSGKLIVVLAFGFVLLVTTLPVAAWCLLLGGFEPIELFYVYTFLFAVAAFVSGLGMFLSAGLRKSIGAVVTTYLTLLVLWVGVPILYAVVVTELDQWSSSGSPTLGAAAATLLVIPSGAILAWMLFVGLQRVIGRLVSGRAAPIATVLAAAGTVAVVAFLMVAQAGPAITALAGGSLWTPGVLHPYVALTCVLFPDAGQELLGSGGSATLTAAAIQTHIWAAATIIFLVTSLVLWVLSTRLLRARAFVSR